MQRPMQGPSTVVDHYQVLDVLPSASLKEINTAYKKLALKHHPDKAQGDDDGTGEFRKIQEAVETLRDPIRRRQHDANLIAARQNDLLRQHNHQYDPFLQRHYFSGWRSVNNPFLYRRSNTPDRYMYSYANSVHMDPSSQESMEERRRSYIEKMVNEALRKENVCPQRKPEQGSEMEQKSEMEVELEEKLESVVPVSGAKRREEGMRARVRRDEEELKREEEGEVQSQPESGYGPSAACDDSGEDKNGEEMIKSEGETANYEGDVNADEYMAEDEDEDEDRFEDFIVSDEEEEEEYESELEPEQQEEEEEEEMEEDVDDEEEEEESEPEPEQQEDKVEEGKYTRGESIEQCASESEYESAADQMSPSSSHQGVNYNHILAYVSGQAQLLRRANDTSTEDGNSDIFSDVFFDCSSQVKPTPIPSNAGEATSSSAESNDEPTIDPDQDPLTAFLNAKLTDPSGRYTMEDLHTELKGITMETYHGWLEEVRLGFRDAIPLGMDNDPKTCPHFGQWEKKYECPKCEACHRWKPIFTLTCPGCGMKACVFCKFEREDSKDSD